MLATLGPSSSRLNRISQRSSSQRSDFGYFWGGQTVSMVGSAISFIALPLVAVSLLHIDPFGMSLLSTDRADIDSIGIGRAGLGAAGATAPVE
jgi:hypothetical protein